ncbi:MAG: hypothetical protein ACFFCW_26840, partial [Candidatus Hodarchaeota archaeon]
MKKITFSKGYVILVMLVLGLSACVGPQTKDVAEFAASGIHFTEQAPQVYDYAFRQEVNADSAKIIGDRDRAKELGISGDKLAETLKERDALFMERLEQFNLMKKHAILMRSYFTALGKLASGEDAEQAGKAAANIANQMESLVPKIKAIEVLDKPISGLFQPITKIAVEALKNVYLKKHLEQHGHTVWNAIELQRDMFVLLLKIEQEQDQNAWRQRETLELAKPLKNLKNDLPANWANQRLALLAVSPAETPLSAAIQATEELQLNLKS